VTLAEHHAFCDRRLPLAQPQGLGRTWFCAGCGTEFIADLQRGYDLKDLRNVHPEPILMPRDQLPEPPLEVQEFAYRLATRVVGNVEKRAARRHALVATVPAVELDVNLQPVGEPFMTTCRNLSTGGVGLLHTRRVSEDFLAVDLAAPNGVVPQLLLYIRRRRPLGPYLDLGCEFVTKMALSVSRDIHG